MVYNFFSIEEIISDAKAGKPFIITDDEDRENEGDIIVSAEFITPELINLMIQKARGLICVAVDKKIAEKFELHTHPRRNVKPSETAFLYSIDAINNTSTGISAADRSTTISKLVDNNASVEDFKVPGHVYPVLAKENGVLERRGHTEAAVDIAKQAKLKPVMVICEIINENGSMARRDDLFRFAYEHKIKISSVDRLVKYLKK